MKRHPIWIERHIKFDKYNYIVLLKNYITKRYQTHVYYYIGYQFKKNKCGLNLASINGKFIFEISANSFCIIIEFLKGYIVDIFKQVADLCE